MTTQNPSQTIDTRIGKLEFTHDFANGYPTDATIAKLYDERDFQRGARRISGLFRRFCSRRGSAVLRRNLVRRMGT